MSCLSLAIVRQRCCWSRQAVLLCGGGSGVVLLLRLASVVQSDEQPQQQQSHAPSRSGDKNASTNHDDDSSLQLLAFVRQKKKILKKSSTCASGIALSSHNAGFWPTITTSSCEASSSSSLPTTKPPSPLQDDDDDDDDAKDPSWLRRILYHTMGQSLPVPRPVRLNDPELQVSPRLVQEREKDAATVQSLQQQLAVAVQARDTTTAQQLVAAVYDTLYGSTVQARTDFLQRYGCTAWNDDILQTLHELAAGRGLVEVDAGHGQWARALREYRDAQWQRQRAVNPSVPLPHPRTFVRAYDDGSKLPLNPQVYHARTQPHRQYFGKVMPLASNSLSSTLAQFENRGRVLLLVYPPADSDLATQAVHAYMAADSLRNDTVVYIGEGRGGATATDAFWELLAADDEWNLVRILPGVPCGTKGDDKVFIFQKRRQQRPTSTTS